MQVLYKLRKDFAIVGLTGRSGAGCSTIAKKLSNKSYINEIRGNISIEEETNDTELLKQKICINYLSHNMNWQPFKIIKYTHVLFYQILFESFYNKDKAQSIEYFRKVIFPNKNFQLNRFRSGGKTGSEINKLIEETVENLFEGFIDYNCETLADCIKDTEKNTYCHFFKTVSPAASVFFDKLRQLDYSRTSLWIQDVACNLRSTGHAKYKSELNSDITLNYIYIIAETINRLIKCFRDKEKHGRVVIDSLKNSLELTFFKERYAAFYCIATNKLAEERKEYKLKRIKKSDTKNHGSHLKINTQIDDTEYKGGQVRTGDFSAPDIENCIQKADYHMFYSENFKKYEKSLLGETEDTVNLDVQLLKFLSLLFNPGIITPSAQERSMQIAYNAKANSGCISRQVGAVITDKNHSVKAIGWNDVAKDQIPCNLRNLNDLVEGKNKDHFSDFELGVSDKYKDGKSFKEKVEKQIDFKQSQKTLNGGNCSFCFKSCHNSFEGKSNQVHTRSLHAEENAMLQITKFGGQGVKGGFLYTTASPCELCSKKAFQLGINKIYFIDPYPGIATTHILKSGKNADANPTLLMFRGAVGRGFHKLYEGFMSYKDELNIRSGLHPKESKNRLIERLTDDKVKQSEIKKILEEE